MTDGDKGQRMGKAREEYTIFGGHMGCHSNIKDPCTSATLEIHLVEVSDDSRLVPFTLRGVAGDPRRCKGRVSLQQGCYRRAPLHLRGP